MRAENIEVRPKQERMRNRGEPNCMETRESEEGVGGGAGECTGGEGVVKRAPTGSSCQLHTVTLSDHHVLKFCSVASTGPSDHDHLTASPKQPIIVPISQRRKLRLLERKCSPNVNMDQY